MAAVLRRLRPLGGDESGFTIVELMITLLVMSAVMAGALTFFYGLMRNDRYQDALVNNQEKVRFAMMEITRDIRNANPPLTFPTFAEYDNQIMVALGPEAGPQDVVRWELDDRTLYRHELDSDGNVTGTRTVLSGVDNVDLGAALFDYFDEDGNRIKDLPTAFPADLGLCAIRVHVTIHAADDPVGSSFTETSDAEVRNRLPGGVGCTYDG
jgi:prepilin-type N-terminal cleavage/methylation domain-containing protein